MKSSKNNLLVPFSPLNTQEFYFKIFLAVVPKSASCLLLYWYVPLHYFLFSPSASSFIILPPLIKFSLFPCASFFPNFALFILSPPLPLPSPFLLYPSSEYLVTLNELFASIDCNSYFNFFYLFLHRCNSNLIVSPNSIHCIKMLRDIIKGNINIPVIGVPSDDKSL